MIGRSELAADGWPFVLLQADMCRLLRVHRSELYRRIRAGEVPAYRRIGSGPRARYEWLRPNVERWLTMRPVSRARVAS